MKMSGVLFIVCVPRAEQELILRKKVDKNLNRNCKRGNILCKCKSSECLSPTQSEDKNEKVDLFKCKSDLTLSADLAGDWEFIKSWEDAKSAGSPRKGNPKKSEEKDGPVTVFESIFPQETPLEKILNEVLERLHVKDAVWFPGKENKYYQVFFSLESGSVSEEAIHLLHSFGIGTRYNSVVSVIPCALYYRAGTPGKDYSVHSNQDDSTAPSNRRSGGGGASAWSRFISSVRARTTLAQVVQDVRSEATLTFDWLFLLLVAAFVSAIGLVENSTVFLVASMLISPLMGPIMAGVVGTALGDTSLQRMGFLHEIFGLFLALVIGFLFGLAICIVSIFIGDPYTQEDWPTFEMISRCEVRSLWVGVLVALPSSVGVALAVLGGYTASLVGVAISASLLPPAVNAGLLWAMALMCLLYKSDSTDPAYPIYATRNISIYSDDPALEMAAHGGVSICLTLVNILCIYVGGVIVYKIKEVAPIDPKNMRFWQFSREEPSEDAEGASARGSVGSQGALDQAAWEFRWCNASERMRLARLACGMRHHDTWSPYTQAPSMHTRDIEAYCRHQASKVGHRRTIAGYTTLTSETSLTSVSEDPGPESTPQARSSLNKCKGDAKKTKFTVTPAADPISTIS